MLPELVYASLACNKDFNLTDAKSPRPIDQPARVMFFLLTLGSLVCRWWWFRNTVGMFYGGGVEEGGRLALAYHFQIMSIMPPLPMALGAIVLHFAPNVVYVTRWLSLIFGLFTPGMVFLALRRVDIYCATGAAVALIVSPEHNQFSTTGTGEALSYFFIAALAYAVGRAFASVKDEQTRRAKKWSIAAVLFCAAASLTRFENWVLIPFVLLYAALRFRRTIYIWIFVVAVPLWWLWYSHKHWGSITTSSHLVPQWAPDAAKDNMIRTATGVLRDVGPIPMVLAALGVLWPLLRRRFAQLSIYGAVVPAFILFMLGQGKIPIDAKYEYNVVVWCQLFFGAGAGAIAALLVERLPNALPGPTVLARWKPAIGLVIVAAIILPLNQKYGAEAVTNRLAAEGPTFHYTRMFAKKAPELYQRFAQGQGHVSLALSLGNRQYFNIYSDRRMQRYLESPGRYWEKKDLLSKAIADLVTNAASVNATPPALVVVDLTPQNSPHDDLKPNQVIEGYSVARVYDELGFRVYRIAAVGSP
jgi:hypothetical protein